MPPKFVLAIGGDDPSGGAGLRVDREAIEAEGWECRSICTAKTQQDDERVAAVGAVEPWRWQFEALAATSVENPVAIKFGLLPSAEAVLAARTVCDQMHFDVPELPVVVDPVLASSSGYAFVDADGLAAYRAWMQRPLILTPNLHEAVRLIDASEPESAWSESRRLEVGEALLAFGLRAVVLKDGHGSGERLRDLAWWRGGEPRWIERPRVAGPGGAATLRGTGCRFASALAARLGRGVGWEEAVRGAGDWVAQRIAAGPAGGQKPKPG